MESVLKPTYRLTFQAPDPAHLHRAMNLVEDIDRDLTYANLASDVVAKASYTFRF